MIFNKTKIIATVGPSCSTVPQLNKMIFAGVNAFRVNMSHGSLAEKEQLIKLVKQLKMKNGARPCIIADLAGPKIRVKGVYPDFKLKSGQKVNICSSGTPDANTVIITQGIMFSKIEKGAGIKINDGRIQLTVVKKLSPTQLECKTIIGGTIQKGKGVNFPGILLKLPTLTAQDVDDLKLAIREDVDWIALSFVRAAKDKRKIDRILKKAKVNIPVIAKIEKWEALQDLEAIITEFDAVMVARGDLGVETPPEQVPLAQKKIIKQANQKGKPVIIATQMLESMISAPVPTRAEVSDIANAIFDGADALMVTGETASGDYPVDVIKVLSKVVFETEQTIDFNTIRQSTGRKNTADAISHATCQVAQDLSAGCIVTMTHSGSTALMISRYRPSVPVVALTPIASTCRKLSIVWGISPLTIEEYQSADDIPKIAEKTLKNKKLIKSGKRYVITGGIPIGVPGTTNYLTILKV
ncbi:MAG TPA: pyruvate kinase [Candidatus Marinimicrobia bacterium]|nr:pyruvate kinase [Candidatus Neomarinimicrobiota bacterium]